MTTAPDPTSLPRLTRAEHGRSAAPIRIIHLGIGNFTRAHQAWYTEHAPDAAQWGIAGFTGRSRRMVDKLDPQGNVYTLITSAPEGDSFEVISSISSMHEGGDMEALRKYFVDPNVSIVTSTVTEAGYKRDAHGNLNVHDTDVSEDLAKLRNDVNASELSTVPARIVAGLEARRAAGADAITILPCDNLAGNGAAFRRVVEQAIEAVDPTLLEWTRDNVAWATSMVDRITPATTDAELRTVAETKGWYDAAPVRTEPFLEWVIQGDFPKGRPAWDEAGAVITDDVEPYEQRKLWMLNGSHSTLPYLRPRISSRSHRRSQTAIMGERMVGSCRIVPIRVQRRLSSQTARTLLQPTHPPPPLPNRHRWFAKTTGTHRPRRQACARRRTRNYGSCTSHRRMDRIPAQVRRYTGQRCEPR